MSINPAEIAKEAIHQLSLQVDLGNLETLSQIAHLRSQADQIGLSSKDIQKLYELEAKATKALVDTIQSESVNLMSKVNEDELNETNAFVKIELRHKIPHLGACIDYQNNVTFTFIKYVLTSDSPHEAAMRLTQLIRIAEQFKQKGNFFMFIALNAALSNSNVGTRLKLIFSMLTNNKLDLFRDFADITDEHNSYANLRKEQSNAKYYDSFIPSLPLLMNDLTLAEGEDVPNTSLTQAEQEILKLERKVKKDAAKSKILEGFRLFKLHHEFPQSADTIKTFKIDVFNDQVTANQYSDKLREQAKELEQQHALGKLPSRAGAAVMTNLTSTISNYKSRATTQSNSESPLDLQQTVNLNETSINRNSVTSSDVLMSAFTSYREDIMNDGIDQAIIQLSHNINAANKLLLYRNISDTETDERLSALKDIKLILDITRLQLMLLKSAKQGNNELYIKIWTSLSNYKTPLTKLISENKSTFIKRLRKLQIATEAYNQLALQEFKKKLHGSPESIKPLENVELLINRLFELLSIAFEKAKTEPLHNVMPIIEEINQFRIKLEQLSVADNYISSRVKLTDALEFNQKYMKNLNEMLANRREADALDKGLAYSNKSSPQSVIAQPIPVEDVEVNLDDINDLIKPVAAPLDDFIFLIGLVKQKCDELKNLSDTHTSFNEQVYARVNSLIHEIAQIKEQLNQTKKDIDLESLFKEIDKVVNSYKKPLEGNIQELRSETDSPLSPMISASSSHDSISDESRNLSEHRRMSANSELDEVHADSESTVQTTQVEVFQPLVEIEQRIVPIRIKIDEIFKSKSITEKERRSLMTQLKELTQQLQPFLDAEHFHRLQHKGSGLGTSYPSDKQKNQFNKEFFEYNDAARRAFNVYQVINYLSVKIENEKITVVPEPQGLMSWMKSAWNSFKNMIGFTTKAADQDTTATITSMTGIPDHKEEQPTEMKVAKKESKSMPRPTALRASRFKGEEPENPSSKAPSLKQHSMTQPKKNV